MCVHSCIGMTERGSNHTISIIPPNLDCNTKLMNVVFTKELALRLEKHNLNIITTSPQPGFTVSDLGSNRGGDGIVYGIFTTIRSMVARTTFQGAATIIEAAVSNKGGSKSTNGKYWSSMGEYAYKKDVDNAKLREKFWDLSWRLAGFDTDPLPP